MLNSSLAALSEARDYAALLQSCIISKAVWQGTRLHHHIIHHGLEGDKYLTRLLIHMYTDCAALADARSCLDSSIHKRQQIAAWNTMLGAYVQHGCHQLAFALFAQLLQNDVAFDRVTLRHVVRAFASQKNLASGQWVHHQIMCSALEMDVFLSTALVSMYNKCGSLDDAQGVFVRFSDRNVVLWSAILGAHEQNCHGKEVFEMFKQMQCEAIAPDRITFVTILSACASYAGVDVSAKKTALDQGKQIHARVFQSDWYVDPDVLNGLINMYGKCGCLKEAHVVFIHMPKRDIVLWNTMVAAYAEHGYEKDALQLFERMQCEGLVPDTITFINMLHAYAQPSDLENGKRMHIRLNRSGFEPDVIVATALVTMYGKCGSLDDAKKMFGRMTEYNLISWNAMIAVYAQHGLGKEALLVFDSMSKAGVLPNKSTFLSLLSACTLEAALALGMIMHTWIMCSGLETHVDVSSALANMYAKCGSSEDAFVLFNNMQSKDLIAWNVIVSSYAQHGHGKKAVQLYERMQQEGSSPNLVTLVGVFYACSHAGLIDEVYHTLTCTYCEHGVAPILEHFDCVIDLLGRAGRLDDAQVLLYNMPFQPLAVSWMILLGACRLEGDVSRGELIAKHMFELDPMDPPACVMMSNIYHAAGMRNEGDQARSSMRLSGLESLNCDDLFEQILSSPTANSKEKQ